MRAQMWVVYTQCYNMDAYEYFIKLRLVSQTGIDKHRASDNVTIICLPHLALISK